MTFAQTTACTLCLLAIWPRPAAAEAPPPRLIAAVPTAAPVAPPAAPADVAGRGAFGERQQVVLFAGRTVEFTVPVEWTVKQVPLPGEIRVLAGPGELPTEPQRLEHGLWIAYHRVAARPGVTLEAELHDWLPRAVGAAFHPYGAPQDLRVGGFPALKQNVEIAAATEAEMPRRASYVLVRTPCGVLEALGVTALFAENEVLAGLKMTLSSLQFHPPAPLPRISAPGIPDAQAMLGSWKGRQVSLHFLPAGRVQLDFDVIATLTMNGERPTPPASASKQLGGAFTARGDVIFITWIDGSKLNYRWRAEGSDLLLMDHTGRPSRLARLFDAPPPYPSPGRGTPGPGDLPIRLPQP